MFDGVGSRSKLGGCIKISQKAFHSKSQRRRRKVGLTLLCPTPPTWLFRLEQQNGVAQGVIDDGTTKVRRSTHKGFGEDSVNECIKLAAKLKLCTNLQIGRAAAVITTAGTGQRAVYPGVAVNFGGSGRLRCDMRAS